jgi:hypothetical protein
MLVLSSIYLWQNKLIIKQLINYVKQWSKVQHVLFFILITVTLILSSVYSGLPDNESYYIQTIKWANEQGFVKGLMNIHPFLGQFSGWHILQSGLNFHGLISNLTFNDLNGLFFISFLYYWFSFYNFNNHDNQKWFVFWPLTAVMLVFFLDSPSPDLPVLLLSLIVFQLFIQQFNHADRYLLLQIFILALFTSEIKLTGIVNFFLVIILFIKHFSLIKKELPKLILLGVFISLLWLLKNYFISGYVFYPFTFFDNVIHPLWQYPKDLIYYIDNLGKQESYALSFNRFILIDFYHWIKQPGWHKFINVLFVLLLIIFPFVIIFNKTKYQKITYLIIYGLGLIYFFIILFINPNFRFFLAFFIFFGLVVGSKLAFRLNKFNLYLGFALFILVSVYQAKKQSFDLQNIIIPKPVSKLTYQFKKGNERDFQYFYPADNTLFWETGDAPLPAIHQNQLQFFKQEFGMIPQQKNKHKKSLYYSKKIK